MKDMIVFAIPFFFLTIGLEMLFGYYQKKKYYNFNDAITNLNIGIGQQTVSLMLTLIMLGLYSIIYDNFHLLVLPVDNAFVWIGTLLAFDCIYYWAHRWGHEWNVMWGAHIVHHQSDQYNLSVALRQSWFHSFLSFWMFLPLALVVPVEVIGGVGGFVTLFQYWIHTKAIKKMPRWFEFIFNTPSHHRVHHATNPQYLDKNYAAVFIFWDRIFGTFAKEEEEPVYGITVGHTSLDPIYANVHFYKEMAVGARKEKSFWRKLTIAFRSPSYLGNLIKEYYTAQPKVNPAPVSMNMRIYVLTQFVALTAGLIMYILEFNDLSTFYKIACLGLVILTIQSCGYILENKTKRFPIEIIRLIGAGVLLNTLYYESYHAWFLLMLVLSISIGFVSTCWFIYENYIKRKEPLKVSNS